MPMTDSLHKLLLDRDDRTAFIAALIMERCTYAPGSPLVQRPAYQPHHAARIATTLVSLAGRIKDRCEDACNREQTEGQEKSLARLEEKFAEIAKEIGLESRTGGDPRGACAYLIDPKAPSDGDGWGKGFAVYA
jgi:hypothetical protein